MTFDGNDFLHVEHCVWLDDRIGFRGGKFLERCRVKKPNPPRYPVEFSKYFTLCDIYVGAVLDVNKFQFQIIDADDYAYNYLEKHTSEVCIEDRFCCTACIVPSELMDH